MTDQAAVAALLRERLAELGWSNRRAAAALGVPASTFDSWVRVRAGRPGARPGARRLDDLAAALGLDRDVLGRAAARDAGYDKNGTT